MQVIYLDSDFKCHVTNDGTMMEYETDVFDGKCQTFIEGYRIVPEGYSWTRADGRVFNGFMQAPWINYTILLEAQKKYEVDEEIENIKAENVEYEVALSEIEAALAVI